MYRCTPDKHKAAKRLLSSIASLINLGILTYMEVPTNEARFISLGRQHLRHCSPES